MRGDILISAINHAAVCNCIAHVQRAFLNRNEAGARAALDDIAALILPNLASINAIAAEAKTTQAHDRTQSTLAAFFVGESRPDLHALNDHGSAPSAPSIA